MSSNRSTGTTASTISVVAALAALLVVVVAAVLTADGSERTTSTAAKSVETRNETPGAVPPESHWGTPVVRVDSISTDPYTISSTTRLPALYVYDSGVVVWRDASDGMEPEYLYVARVSADHVEAIMGAAEAAGLTRPVDGAFYGTAGGHHVPALRVTTNIGGTEVEHLVTGDGFLSPHGEPYNSRRLALSHFVDAQTGPTGPVGVGRAARYVPEQVVVWTRDYQRPATADVPELGVPLDGWCTVTSDRVAVALAGGSTHHDIYSVDGVATELQIRPELPGQGSCER